MPPLQQIFNQIQELDPLEQEELAIALSEKLLPIHPMLLKWLEQHHVPDYPSIVSTPNVCGGAARVIRTRIPVWTLERMRQLGMSEIDILRSYPTLRAVDLVQASSYAAHNRTEIEQAIREHEEE
jgi:uncharacterized protein (DUF433 family)